jgi:AraC-like DNA-binding protein
MQWGPLDGNSIMKRGFTSKLNSSLAIRNDMKSKKGVKLEFGRRMSPIPFENFRTGDLFNASNHEAISRSLRFMAQNFSRPIKLGDVIVISGMSRRGFLKAFSRHVGFAPGSFLRQARIEFAKRLLTEQDLPLKTIAEIAGFRSENTFWIAFKRATGMAPKQFQHQAWRLAYCSDKSKGFFRSGNS